MKKYNWLCLLFSALAWSGCKEEPLRIVTESGKIPELVTNIRVENIPGGAVIAYDLPAGQDLMYVEAEYQLNSGQVQRVHASAFSNMLRIEGFGDTSEYKVNLYSVGKGLKRSEPVTVTVHPKLPPVLEVYQSLVVREDFGGIAMEFLNIHQAEVTVNVEIKDSIGDWTLADIFYTSQAQGKLAVRGMEPVATSFGISVKDRWGNQSERMELELTPLYEERIPLEGFRVFNTPTDPVYHQGGPLHNLWNDRFSGGSSSRDTWTRTANGTGMPHHLTFDMGVQAKLSRFVLHQRGVLAETNLLYSGGTPTHFEVWGSNAPASDGSYDGWIKLMDCEIIKPSGRPVPENTGEDIETAQAGHEYSFPLDAEPVRYIRLRVLRTFGNTDYSWWGNLAIYGQIQ